MPWLWCDFLRRDMAPPWGQRRLHATALRPRLSCFARRALPAPRPDREDQKRSDRPRRPVPRHRRARTGRRRRPSARGRRSSSAASPAIHSGQKRSDRKRHPGEAERRRRCRPASTASRRWRTARARGEQHEVGRNHSDHEDQAHLPLVALATQQCVERDERKQDTKQIGCHAWALSSTRERVPSTDEVRRPREDRRGPTAGTPCRRSRPCAGRVLLPWRRRARRGSRRSHRAHSTRLPTAVASFSSVGWTAAKPTRGHRIDPHDARLQLGDFGERGVDGVLDRANLGGDFESGIFDHLFAHDCSFPGAPAPEWLSVRSDCRLLAASGAWRGFRARRDTCPPRTPLRSRSPRSRTASGRHSSHSGGCSSLRTAVAGKAGKKRASARLGNQFPRPPLRGQRAEFECWPRLLGWPD